MKNSKSRLVNLIPPAVPMWAVFFEEDEPDHVFILPVMGLAIVEMPDGDREIHPLVFDQTYGVDIAWWEDNNSLGYLLEEELPKAAEIFADQITRKKERLSTASS